jgi:hypothetical protein
MILQYIGIPLVSWNEGQISKFIRGLCLSLIVVFSYKTGVEIKDSLDFKRSLPKTAKIGVKSSKEKRKISLAEYQFIINRSNIFGLSSPIEARVNTLPLRLAMSSRGRDIFGNELNMAIIEDKRNGKQELFEENDLVFDIGELISIHHGYVYIVHNSVKYKLSVEDEVSPQQEEVKNIEEEIQESLKSTDNKYPGIKEISFRNYEIEKEMIEKALSDLDNHLRGGYSKPHKEGIIIYGLRRDSIFKEMGLSDFDIITKVNGRPVNSFIGAAELFTEFTSKDLSELGTVVVTVKRAGLEIPIHYNIVD